MIYAGIDNLPFMNNPHQNRESFDFIKILKRVSFGRLLPAILWLVYAYSAYINFQNSLESGNWIIIIRLTLTFLFLLIIVILFIIRYPVQGEHARSLGAIVAVVGTIVPFALAFQPIRFSSPALIITSNIIIVVGLIWACISIIALGRSFGIFPEARGLVIRGPYRIVRHPLYLGEIIVTFGLMLPVISPLAILIFATEIALQIWRISFEEPILEDAFPEYSTYKENTKRLVPFIW